MSGVLPKRYKTVKELGRGGFGTVYLAQDLSADGSLVAIKVIDTRQVNPKYISQEVMVHMSARHAQIVPVLEIHNLPDDYMAIVMEYIAGGDLLTYVQTKRYGGGREGRVVRGPKQLSSRVVRRNAWAENLWELLRSG